MSMAHHPASGISKAASLGMAVCLMGNAASARIQPQMQTGSMFPAKPKVVDPARVARIEHATASCIYSRHRDLVDRLLASSDPVTMDCDSIGKGRDGAVEKLELASCLGKQVQPDETQVELKAAVASLRFLFAEAAYLARFGRAAINSALPPNSPERRYVSTGDDLARARAFTALADCVVARDRAGADALLRTEGETPAEMQAARNLAPGLATCLTGGETFHLNAVAMRRIASEGLWGRYVAALRPFADGTGTAH